MKSPVLFDLEICSAADLPAVGGRNYAVHESTRVLIGCFLIDGSFVVWLPGRNAELELACYRDLWPMQFGERRHIILCGGYSLPEYVKQQVSTGREFIAHNCHEFDEHVWRAKMTPVPVSFGDTIHAARAAGLPAKLDDLGKRFFGVGKDAGQLIMSRMWKLERNESGEWINKNQIPGNIALAARYCIGDVVILEKVYQETLGFGEPGVIEVHRAINNRGVRFDTALARTLIDFSNHAAANAGAEIERLTHGELKPDDLRKVAKVKAWVESKGFRLDNLRKQTVEQLLNDPDSFLEELEDHE